MLTGVRATLAVLILASPWAALYAQDVTEDGLIPVKVRNIDAAYKRPDASLKGYDRILLKPVTVTFSKQWHPRDFGGPGGLSAKDVERIRTSLASLAEESFRQVLTDGGYTLVDDADQGVLEVEVDIVDLYVNAPDTMQAGRSRTYVMNAGEMRIVMDLRDAATGTTLYRAIDKKRGRETGRLEWANSAWNRAEAKRALDDWARRLKGTLDAARHEP